MQFLGVWIKSDALGPFKFYVSTLDMDDKQLSPQSVQTIKDASCGVTSLRRGRVDEVPVSSTSDHKN